VNLPYLDAGSLLGALPMIAAIDALEAALRGGLDPAADPRRTALAAEAGQLLVMPSSVGADIAVKLVSVAPGNPARGRPRIQGVVVLFDPADLAPLALLDGIALTSLRTPAVSALAVRRLAAAQARRLVVFGAGPQAEGHVEAIRAVRPIDEVVLVGRDPAKAQRLAATFAAGDPASRCVYRATQARDVLHDLAAADVVVCATTAREPVFDSAPLRSGAVVVAVGSHEPDAREVDAALVGRAHIVVEDVATAAREAGDLVLADADPAGWQSLADLVRAGPAREPGPYLVKTVGMAWEDAVVAGAATRAWLSR
jgi:ornithine cyclodeaminase